MISLSILQVDVAHALTLTSISLHFTLKDTTWDRFRNFEQSAEHQLESDCADCDFSVPEKASPMPFFQLLLNWWLPSLLSLLLLTGLAGLRVRVQAAHACSRWGAPSDGGLFQHGDAIIGGLFSLYYEPPPTALNFTHPPDYKSCTG